MTEQTTPEELERREVTGSFVRLTPQQLRANARVVARWCGFVLLVVVGVVAAVATGITWIAAGAALLAFMAWRLDCRYRKSTYTPRFGVRYNLARAIVGLFLIYHGSSWKSLIGVYHRITESGQFGCSTAAFGWTVIAAVLPVLVAANCYLTFGKAVSREMADFLGVIEMVAVVLVAGAMMFLLIY